MPLVQITINQAGSPAGVPSVSREDIVIGVPVILTNNNNTGAIKHKWEFLSVPIDEFGNMSIANILTPNSPTASFVPDIIGTYIIQLTINDRMIGTAGAAVPSVALGRFPGIRETNEFGVNGWGTTFSRLFSTLDALPLPGVVAGGNLDGYYPNPNVIGITEGYGMGDNLPIDMVSDGYFLRRNGNSITGSIVDQVVESSGPTVLNITDIFDGYFLRRDGNDIRGSIVDQVVESSGPTVLTFGAIPDGEFFKRDGVNAIGGYPPLQNCYEENPEIEINASGVISLLQELNSHRSFDLANAVLRISSNETAISGQMGIDMDGYADHDFACIDHRCKINNASIGQDLTGNVVGGLLTIVDPVDLNSVSTDLLLYVKLEGGVNGLFKFSKINATTGDIYDLDNGAIMPDGDCTATFYYPRFHIGSNTEDSTFMGPGPSRVNMLTFGGFDNTNSSIGHLHYVYQTGGISNEEFTKKTMLVIDGNNAEDLTYETSDGEYHARRLIAGVAPTAYSHATDPTARIKNDGAGPAVQADDYVYDSEHDGYLWVDLMASSRIGAGAADDWTFKSDDPNDIGDATWDGVIFESMQLDGYQVINCNDWPEGMKLNFIEVDWWSNIGLGRGVRLMATRQEWPAASGDKITNHRLNSGYTEIRHAGDSVRRWNYFECDQNNLNWYHDTNKLVIVLVAGETGSGERVYGIRLNVTYRSVGKFDTNLSTDPV